MRGCHGGLDLIREGFPEEVRWKLKDGMRRPGEGARSAVHGSGPRGQCKKAPCQVEHSK